jgi:hypothetical protein
MFEWCESLKGGWEHLDNILHKKANYCKQECDILSDFMSSYISTEELVLEYHVCFGNVEAILMTTWDSLELVQNGVCNVISRGKYDVSSNLDFSEVLITVGIGMAVNHIMVMNEM